MLLLLSSCEIAGSIFKAGFYVGLAAAIIVVIFIIYLFIKYRGGSSR